MPWDVALRVAGVALSPAAAEVTSLVGVQTSFAQAAEVTLKKLCGLRLSESTVERTTEGAGERLAKLQGDRVRLGEKHPWSWQRDAEGRTCAYVSIDATGIRQQGEGGARADGRMANVGIVYNPQNTHDGRRRTAHQVRYLAGFHDLSTLAAQLRRQADEVGWNDAEVHIALSDGGAGLEEALRAFFPQATCILDFWHAKEHLVELAGALWPDDEAQRKSWLDAQCPRLKHAGGAAVLDTLEALDVSQRSLAVQEVHRRHVGYFRNNVHRMDYPTYVERGWQIGSGPVESACKTVVGNRLKGGGMRWGEAGADHVCRLRALHLSEPNQWQAFWQNHPN